MVARTLKPSPKSGIVESEELLGNELFLYDESNGAVHTLTSGAAMIWLLCDGHRDLESISQEIGLVSNLPAEQVLPQVVETVSEFRSLGLLEG